MWYNCLIFCVPLYPKSVALFGGLQALPFYTLDHGSISLKIRVGYLADYHEKGKSKGQRGKPVPVLIYPPQIPNRLAVRFFLRGVGGESCEGTGFSLSASVVPCQCLSTNTANFCFKAAVVGRRTKMYQLNNERFNS